MINKERVLAEFMELVKMTCISKQEREVGDLMITRLQELGGMVVEDVKSREALGGNCGNLVATFKGNVEKAPTIMLTAHLDCVVPCANVKPQIKDGIITSDGTTILGGDCKAGMVPILETLRVLKEENLPHGDIQVVFSVCEELGLAGSKNMDQSLLHADFGFTLDSSGRPGKIIDMAPGQNKINVKVYGKTAHAGLAPEKGINAIKLAAQILTHVPQGRIDEETTCNIGLISGGRATNIVPDTVEIKGECRSRNQEKMEKLTQEIVDAYKVGAQEAGAKIDIEVLSSYNPYVLPHDSTAMIIAKKAAENVGLVPDITGTGGGSDANHFNEYGISCTVLGVGMTNCHTCEEYIIEEDLYKTTEWVLEMVKLTAKQ
ncbi:MAG: M20/M25/M40 family metallo-hydrolase [Acidaminococcaceae bacterium]|nr:M20/M25/M40 family metallo-hydrolase [Acidaminococcaceae bacterium]